MLKLRQSTLLLRTLSQNRPSSTSVTKTEIPSVFTNRNPRNLEKLRIGYKPDGFHVDKPGKCFWHKLQLSKSEKHVTASVIHFQNGEVVKASTSEWAIKQQLYKPNDISAYMNLGRVLAGRCLKSGIIEMRCDIIPQNPEGKVAEFLKAFEEGGIKLQEPPQYKKENPWDKNRAEKPWEVVE